MVRVKARATKNDETLALMRYLSTRPLTTVVNRTDPLAFQLGRRTFQRTVSVCSRGSSRLSGPTAFVKS
jgi:hypothetical protein